MLATGDKAPLFTAPGTEGEVDLGAVLAQSPVVLFFFPKAFTPGWTTEAVEFDRALADFRELGVAVLGISTDSVERLQRFRDKYELGYALVSDSERAIGRAYGTLKSEHGSHNRDTVLIAADGRVVAAYEKVKAKGHAAEVLEETRRARAEARV